MPAIRTGLNDIDKHSIVLHESKKVFMPIGKCAGTSIRNSLTDPYEFKTKDEVWRDFRDYEKIAVVRNPFDRLVSVYSFFTQKDSWGSFYFTDKVEDILFNSFHEFIGEVYQRPDDISNCHYRSQYSLLTCYGDFMPDTVIKYEEIEKITTVLPISDLKWLHKSNRGEYKHYYTPKLAKMVGERFKKDLEAFGYEMALH